MWCKYKNLNKNSIGIELVNRGHQYGYQNYTKKQINKLGYRYYNINHSVSRDIDFIFVMNNNIDFKNG